MRQVSTFLLLAATVAVAACAGDPRLATIEIGPASPSGPSLVPAESPRRPRGSAVEDPCEKEIRIPRKQEKAPIVINGAAEMYGRRLAPARIKAALALGQSAMNGGQVFCSYQTLAADPGHVYVRFSCNEMRLEHGRPILKSGTRAEAVIDVEATAEALQVSARIPRDAPNYGPDLRAMFSQEAFEAMGDSDRYAMERAILEEATCRLRERTR